MKFTLMLTSLLLYFGSIDIIQTVSQVQDTVHWVGYYANYFGRKVGRDLEWTTRPNQNVEFALAKKFARYSSIALSAPIAFAALPIHIICNLVASYIPAPRIRIIHGIPTGSTSNTLSIISLNACLHEGLFAPTTGGVVPPFDPVGHCETRLSAIVEIIGAKAPDIFIGQEFHDLRAIREFIKQMKTYGYTSFAYDPSPHLLCLNSGLFIASKRKITDISFIPFSLKDRGNKAKALRMGTLTFTVLNSQNKPMVRFFNAHLNSGGPESQYARNNQLKSYILPRFSDPSTPAILLGDFNFNTAEFKEESGLQNYVNILEGQITCTNEGKLSLRGRQRVLELEKIDAIIGNCDRVQFSNSTAQPLKIGRELLSDHYMLSTTAHIE